MVQGTIIAEKYPNPAQYPMAKRPAEQVITLHQLKLFVSVAKGLSMTQTSREFHVSQSAVSHQIKKLEREFGKTFLQRNRRAMHLTEAGSAFLRDSEAILSRVADLYRKDTKVLLATRPAMEQKIPSRKR